MSIQSVGVNLLIEVSLATPLCGYCCCVGGYSLQVCGLLIKLLNGFQMGFTLDFLQRSVGLGLARRFVDWGPADSISELKAVLCTYFTHIYTLNL